MQQELRTISKRDNLNLFYCTKWRCTLPRKDCLLRQQRAKEWAHLTWKNRRWALNAPKVAEPVLMLSSCMDCKQGKQNAKRAARCASGHGSSGQ
jgi:hypothetical protein